MKTQRMTEISPEGKELRRWQRIQTIGLGIVIAVIVAAIISYHQWTSEVGPNWSYRVYYACGASKPVQGQVYGPTREEAIRKVIVHLPPGSGYNFDVWRVGEAETTINTPECHQANPIEIIVFVWLIIGAWCMMGAAMSGRKR